MAIRASSVIFAAVAFAGLAACSQGPARVTSFSDSHVDVFGPYGATSQEVQEKANAACREYGKKPAFITREDAGYGANTYRFACTDKYGAPS
jgi:hypothetical protein